MRVPAKGNQSERTISLYIPGAMNMEVDCEADGRIKAGENGDFFNMQTTDQPYPLMGKVECYTSVKGLKKDGWVAEWELGSVEVVRLGPEHYQFTADGEAQVYEVVDGNRISMGSHQASYFVDAQ